MTDVGAPWEDAAAPEISGGGPPSRFYLSGRTLAVAAVSVVVGGVCILLGSPETGEGFYEPLILKGVFLVGAGVIVGAWPDMARLWYRRQVRKAGGEPWRLQEYWTPVATLSLERRQSRAAAILRKVVVVVMLAVALVVAVSLLASRRVVFDESEWIALVAGVVAPLVGARLVRGRRHSVVVGFASFPCHSGERAQMQLWFGEGAPPPDDALHVTLQCVRGGLSRGPAGWASTAIQILLPADSWPVPGTPGLVAVEFDLPPDAPGTDLLSLPAHTWQLVVTVETPDGAWDGQVPAPVFERAAPHDEDVR